MASVNEGQKKQHLPIDPLSHYRVYSVLDFKLNGDTSETL